MDIEVFISAFAPIILASSDSDGAAAAPLLLLLSGFIFYGVMYARYRNADKRHTHESETLAEVVNLQSGDTFIQSKKGLSNARMNGANHTRIEGALNQGQGGSKLLESLSEITKK